MQPSPGMEIAPSTELRKWYGHDAAHGTVTLIFSAHDAEHSNAVVLRDLLG
jgi:uncharacterized protein YeaO (DUF488 family)